jgi:hypothetical protein
MPTEHREINMSETIIRHLRLHCQHPAARPEPHKDGVLAVAAIHEEARLARLLLTDMSAWGRGGGASVTNAIDVLVPTAHRYLVAGFGISLQDTLIAECDGSGHFDLVHERRTGPGYRHAPLLSSTGKLAPRSREAFLSWAGPPGHSMLAKVQAVADGAWAGVEG